MTLTEDQKSLITGFIRTTCYTDVQTIRQDTLRRLIRNNFIWQGQHYIAPIAGAPNAFQYGGINADNHSYGTANTGQRAYCNSYNYYKGDGKKLMGILGRTPNAYASAIHQRDDRAVADAANAQKIIEELRWHWDVEVLNAYLVFYLWTCGPVYGYTPYGVDSRRYGVTRIPKYTKQSVEVEPGVFENFPVINPDDPYDEFPNGSVSLILCNDYEIIKPTRLKSMEQAPWWIYEREVHKANLLENYRELNDPELFQRVNTTHPALDHNGRTARDQAASTTAYNYPTGVEYWTQSDIWLLPSMLRLMKMSQRGHDQFVDQMLAEYPDGVKITNINGYPIRVEAENLHDVWFECPCEVGHSLDEPALGDETARINRSIDDLMNVAQEVAEKGSPMTLYRPEMITPEAIRNHANNPVDYIPVALGGAQNIRDGVYTFDAVELSPTIPPFRDLLVQTMRDNSGLNPALFGDVKKEQTLGEAELSRNMALLPHNVAWNFIRRLFAGVYTNGVRQIARYGWAKAYFGGQRNGPVKEIEIEDLRNLLNNTWKVECEEAIPQTWGQERAQVFQILGMNPEILNMLGIMSPRNVEGMLKTLGTREFILAGESQRKKTLGDIKMLLREQPIMGQMGPQASQPPDLFADDPVAVVAIVREWALENQIEKQANKIGYDNVILWAQEYQMAIPPPMPVEGEGAPPAGGGSEPPPQNDLGSLPPGGVDPTTPLAPEELSGMALEGA